MHLPGSLLPTHSRGGMLSANSLSLPVPAWRWGGGVIWCPLGCLVLVLGRLGQSSGYFPPKLFMESEIRSRSSIFGVTWSEVKAMAFNLGFFLVLGTFMSWTFHNALKGKRGCFPGMSMQWATLQVVLFISGNPPNNLIHHPFPYPISILFFKNVFWVEGSFPLVHQPAQVDLPFQAHLSEDITLWMPRLAIHLISVPEGMCKDCFFFSLLPSLLYFLSSFLFSPSLLHSFLSFFSCFSTRVGT